MPFFKEQYPISMVANTHVSPAIPINAQLGGVLIIPPLDATSVVAFLGAPSADGTFVPLCDEAGTLITISPDVNTLKGYKVPDGVSRVPHIKLWTQVSYAPVVQTAQRDFILIMAAA